MKNDINSIPQVQFQVYIRPTTKQKLDYLKSNLVDIPWDLIFEVLLKDIKVPKPQTHSLPPILPIVKEIRELYINKR